MIFVRNVFLLKFGKADFERGGKESMGKEEWRAWYARFSPLCEGGHRDIFAVVE